MIDITFEDYIKERMSIFDKAQVFQESLIDEDTGEKVDFYKTDYKKADAILEKLDLKYKYSFVDKYILYRRSELDKWIPYVIRKLSSRDSHNMQLTCQHIGRNMTLNSHKILFIRRGFFKQTSEEEIKELFGWHTTNINDKSERYLYIFKNELGRIKIGQAKSVDQRNFNIKIQAGIEISILNTIEGASRYEYPLHKIFKGQKYAGEWFVLDDSQIQWLCSLNKINIEYEVEYLYKLHGLNKVPITKKYKKHIIYK
jgi:hypothetical protein